ncbi:oxygen-independent coproporphyrinogen III oxidase [Thiocapsa imhoffii]|uniref:Coproporphyrinogen-III oxidase n=1 Tax=Thiocapsa imhoffii TaxID=382777 RepID=A0A9X1B7V7_9GAMM|nr:oxygen-independent coproporphyrinogen III oxidase [Thiocapsa imhoffii]MBK1643415.1 oxygen-independent coproporphyrinogen III oxidase [Thiocapsa imhoffii]
MVPPLPARLPPELLERFGHPTPGHAQSVILGGDTAFSDVHYREALVALSQRPQDHFALYVHVPFCHVRCLYCACNTTITHSEERVDQYLDALDHEMSLVTEIIGKRRVSDQLHVGGGTPNHLNEPQLARLMEIVERHFEIAETACTSVECNPRRTSAGQLDLLYGLGFRRISFGVQDLNADVQRAIGRVQSLDMVRDVFLTARDTGFESINLDLIYGLPFQTLAGFQHTLDQIVALSPDRIACFSYAHDPVSRPHQHAIRAEHLPSIAEKLQLFHQAVESFSAAGYRWVGTDVFARETDELTNAQKERRLYRNAIGYTPAPAKQVLAFGPSGIGEVGGVLVQNAPDLKTWERQLAQGLLPVGGGRRLTEQDRRRREAILYLMCNLELPASSAKGLEHEYESLCRNGGQGLLEVTNEGIRVTPEGRYLLHGLCVEQDASVDWGSTQWRAMVSP